MSEIRYTSVDADDLLFMLERKKQLAGIERFNEACRSLTYFIKDILDLISDMRSYCESEAQAAAQQDGEEQDQNAAEITYRAAQKAISELNYIDAIVREYARKVGITSPPSMESEAVSLYDKAGDACKKHIDTIKRAMDAMSYYCRRNIMEGNAGHIPPIG